MRGDFETRRFMGVSDFQQNIHEKKLISASFDLDRLGYKSKWYLECTRNDLKTKNYRNLSIL